MATMGYEDSMRKIDKVFSVSGNPSANLRPSIKRLPHFFQEFRFFGRNAVFLNECYPLLSSREGNRHQEMTDFKSETSTQVFQELPICNVSRQICCKSFLFNTTRDTPL